MIKKLKIDEMNRLSIADFKEAGKIPLIAVLDNVRSQHNIGSVFRTADAFRLQCIYLCGITATPPNREIHKTALGATESVAWKYFKTTIDAVNDLRCDGFTIITIEQASGSTMIDKFFPEKGRKYALIFGNEVNGVDDEVINISDLCLEIPQSGTKHSLNVSVSAGIIIWDFFSKMRFEI